ATRTGTKLVADPGDNGIKVKSRNLRERCVNGGAPSHVVISGTDDESVLWEGNICSDSADDFWKQVGADGVRAMAQGVCDSYRAESR
ncbi:MAG TPA: hypothetical protein VJB62_04440, partial [Patescibacteria group bacterium]|nr:hypothetical protein [Patescibacteria group bacterium]